MHITFYTEMQQNASRDSAIDFWCSVYEDVIDIRKS